MSARIVYPLTESHYAVVMPAAGWDVAQVARRDVPAGTPYLIVDSADLVEGFAPDFGAPDGVGIGYEAWAAEEAARLLAEAAPPAEGEAP